MDRADQISNLMIAGFCAVGLAIFTGLSVLVYQSIPYNDDRSPEASAFAAAGDAKERPDKDDKPKNASDWLFGRMTEGTESEFENAQEAIVSMSTNAAIAKAERQEKENARRLAEGKAPIPEDNRDPFEVLNDELDNNRLLNGGKRKRPPKRF